MAARGSHIRSHPQTDAAVLRKAAALHEAGNPKQAAALYRRYLKGDPDNAEVLHTLGGLYYQLEDLEAAGRYLQMAHEADPTNLDFLGDLGAFHTMHGNHEAAIECLRRVVAQAPDYAQAWYNLAMAFYGAQRFSEAVSALESAVSAAPDFAGAYCNLGRILMELGQLKKAEEAYRKAITVQPYLAEAHYGLGEVLGEQERADLACEALREAYRLDEHNPKIILRFAQALALTGRTGQAIELLQGVAERHPQVASLYTTLGGFLHDAGRLKEAEAAFRHALVLKPDAVNAWYSLGHVRKFSDTDKSDIERMETLLRRKILEPSASMAIEFALGKVYDDCRDYDRAFGHYASGNAIKHERVSYDRELHAQRVDALVDVFDKTFYEQHQGMGTDQELPIFIVGMARSGTTLVEQIVASHPEVTAGGELMYFGSVLAQLSRMLQSELEAPWCCRSITKEIGGEIICNYLRLLRRHSNTARFVTDKMPGNYLHLGLIRLLFPNAPIIHCRRHPLDVCLSIFFQWFTEGHEYAYDLVDIGHRYAQYERLMEHWRSVLPGPMVEIQYEDLVADQEARSRELIAFCGLPWDDACLSFHKTERTVQTASNWQVRQPIYKTSRERWRNYERHLQPLMDQLGIASEEVQHTASSSEPRE